tara:strand:- start:15 stop:650 length:636 start_codon:yes stop_codon:yes gene_type:complete
MDFRSLKARIITSSILIFLFFFVVLFYDIYLKILAYIVYLIILLELVFYFRKNIYLFIISLIYLSISLVCLELYFRDYFFKEEFIYTIILVIIFDIASYFFGLKFGRFRILPKISPKKTYEGFISGFILAFILGSLINYYYIIFETPLMIFFIMLILISAFLGDIVESIFKRVSNLKNSSEFLPGHGGFFDRFDSLIMVFISLLFFKLIIY